MTQSERDGDWYVRGQGFAVPGAGSGSDQGWRMPGRQLAAHLSKEHAALFGWVPVMIALGAALYFAVPHEPSLLITVLLLVAALTLTWLMRGRTEFRLATTVLLLILVGFGAGKIRTEWVRAPTLERTLSNVDIYGFVERIEAKPTRGGRLTLRPVTIGKLAPDALPFRIRVRVMTGIGALSPGVAVRLRARLAPPPPPALPGGFDFARHAWFQGIGAVGYSLSRPHAEPYAGPVPWSLQLAARIESLRQVIASRMRAHVSNQSGAIAIALVTGERGGISERTNQIYRDAGLFHILSISGMHMAIMAGAVFFIVRLGFSAVPSLVLRYPTKKLAALIAALGYLALSGGAFATLRSYIMISVMFFAVLLDRPALALRNVALAACIILLLFPESVLDPGFQMSFAAVVALVSVYEWFGRSRWAAVIAEFGPLRRALFFFAGIILSTVVAGLAVAPFAAYHFHTTQHLAVIANLIAMPVSNAVIMPAALGVLVLMPLGLEGVAVHVMGFGIDIMTATAAWVAGLPGAVGRIATMPLVAFFMMVFGGLWLVLWQTRWRFGGLAAIALGVALVPFGPRPDILVGNKGRAVVVRGEDGRLHSLKPRRRVSFAVKRWLEADGHPVPVRRDRPTGARTTPPATPPYRRAVRCDAVGCVAKVKGLTLAVAHHAGALRDDCRQADIVVFNAPAPEACTAPRRVIDFFDIHYGGTHAVYVDDPNHVRVERVAGVRGRRPWTRSLPGRKRRQAAARSSPAAPTKTTKDHLRPLQSFDDDSDDDAMVRPETDLRADDAPYE